MLDSQAMCLFIYALCLVTLKFRIATAKHAIGESAVRFLTTAAQESHLPVSVAFAKQNRRGFAMSGK